MKLQHGDIGVALLRDIASKGVGMTFVTERISDEEFLKYNIAKTCYGDQAEGKRYWSIDRDRDIYLRRAWIDWQCPSDEYWSFYWKGVEGCVRTFTLDFISEENGWSKESIRVGLSPVIMASGPEDVIRNDFMEAYRSHSDNRKSVIAFSFT